MAFSVKKRSGSLEKFNTKKIFERIQALCNGLNMQFVDCNEIADKVLKGSYDKITTEKIDELSAETAMYMSSTHSDYGILAARIAVSNFHKETKSSFYETMRDMKDIHLSETFFKTIEKNKYVLDREIDHTQDYNYDYFGFKTLMKSYLFKLDGKTIERPQHMLMRVAIGIHGNDIKLALETYKLMSVGYFTHASPTLYNAGTTRSQFASCFLLNVADDSIVGIYDTLKKCAEISKVSGGVGLAVHKVRPHGSFIKGTNGYSDGIVPMLKVYNETARYVNQGGRRPGAFAVYLEPWHGDILEFLELKKNTGKEETIARDLFYALWIPDEFMRRVEKDESWSLMCPNKCPGLNKAYGEDFDKLYRRYEEEGKFIKQIPARQVWNKIIDAQIETGTPYMSYKDAVNMKSNQKNVGTIECSNLCCEIVEYTSPDEIAVCTLASIALPKFVKNGVFDFEHLQYISSVVTRNLNKIIDINYYPVKEAEYSNLRHRPIGIGVQGLADVFLLLRYPFGSAQAKELNVRIFETIYYGALTASMELSKQYGPYQTFKGSPASSGILQFDMWGVKPTNYDWDVLKSDIIKYGLRNSLLTACMPTAGTSQILGNSECIEPYMSNIFTRRTMAGEFIIINKHLLADLIKLKLWTSDMKDRIIYYNGSIQHIAEIPDTLKELYKTAFEIKQKDLIDLSADRGAFVCQTQSLNLFVNNPDYNKITSMHFYGWKRGLKTGQYYLRSAPAVNAIQFGVSTSVIKQEKKNKNKRRKVECTEDVCTSCSA